MASSTSIDGPIAEEARGVLIHKQLLIHILDCFLEPTILMRIHPDNYFMDAIGEVEFLGLPRFENEHFVVLLNVRGFKFITILRNPRGNSGSFQALSFLFLSYRSLLVEAYLSQKTPYHCT